MSDNGLIEALFVLFKQIDNRLRNKGFHIVVIYITVIIENVFVTKGLYDVHRKVDFFVQSFFAFAETVKFFGKSIGDLFFLL